MNILIVRLGALGDIVHAIPAAAALRAAFPHARIDWIVEARHRGLLDLVPVIDRIVTLEGRTLRAWTDALRRVRQIRYDVALDFQGLMKSAVLARASGAPRVAGFSIWHLREKTARPFYSETDAAGRSRLRERDDTSNQPGRSDATDGQAGATDDEELHVAFKNLRLLRVVGIETDHLEFPLANVESAAAEHVRAAAAGRPIALLNPGAAWPNKRWHTDRYGEVATFLRDVRGMLPVVLWGPGEQELAQFVIESSGGAAMEAPRTNISDLVEVARNAQLIVSGDTAPLHIAAAVGTPVVGIFGPTNPRRNGPWSADDEVISRYDTCACHYDRRCRQAKWCLTTVTVAEVTAAIQQRMARNAQTARRGHERDG
jgi:heptosyltransferase-1